MAEAHFSFAPLGSAGDSNTEHMHSRFGMMEHVIVYIFIALTDAHGWPVCTTMMKDGEVDKSYNLPARTPCHDRAHYARTMQVYHDRALYTMSYDPAYGIHKITAPLVPPIVPEAAGGD